MANPSVTTISGSMQDGVLKAMEVSQRLTIEALSAFTSTVDGVLPTRPMPLPEGVMSPSEAIDTGFAFVEKVLESQKGFLLELATITAPAPAAGPAKK